MKTPFENLPGSKNLRFRIVPDDSYFDDSFLECQGIEDPEEIAKNRTELWDQIAREGVWGYQIERRKDAIPKCPHCAQETPERWELIDSCWGFVGYEVAEQEANASIAYEIKAGRG